MRLAEAKRVLDLASGEGYGAALLARTAADVVGIDPDESSIAHARSSYYHRNLRFLRGEATSVPLKDESVDLITSFETMQRVWDQETMLDELRRVLTRSGLLILSTPNKLVYSDRSGFSNPYHVRELYYAELRDMLVRRFPYVRIYGQRIVASSVLHPLAGNGGGRGAPRWYAAAGDGVREELPELPHPVHFIAVCGDDAPDVEIASAFLDPQDDLLADVQDELDALRAHVRGASAYELSAPPAAPVALVEQSGNGSAHAAAAAQHAGLERLSDKLDIVTEELQALRAIPAPDAEPRLADMRAWCESQVSSLTAKHAAALAALREEHERALSALHEELAERTEEARVMRERAELFDAFKEQARSDLANVREQARRERSATDRAAAEMRERAKRIEYDLSLARNETADARARAARAEDELAAARRAASEERERRRTAEALPAADPAVAEPAVLQLQQLAAELELVRAELAEQQRAAAARELSDAETIRDLQRDLQRDSEALQAVLGSRSWRLTAPLRRAGSRLRKGP